MHLVSIDFDWIRRRRWWWRRGPVFCLSAIGRRRQPKWPTECKRKQSRKKTTKPVARCHHKTKMAIALGVYRFGRLLTSSSCAPEGNDRSIWRRAYSYRMSERWSLDADTQQENKAKSWWSTVCKGRQNSLSLSCFISLSLLLSICYLFSSPYFITFFLPRQSFSLHFSRQDAGQNRHCVVLVIIVVEE